MCSSMSKNPMHIFFGFKGSDKRRECLPWTKENSLQKSKTCKIVKSMLLFCKYESRLYFH